MPFLCGKLGGGIKLGKLTRNQQVFCDGYLIDLNATRAYLTAYPSVKKEATAAAAASRLLRNVKVKVYIDKKMKEREKRTEITQDKVLKELAKIGFANATDYAKVVEKEYEVDKYDPEGNVVGKEIKMLTVVELELTENIEVSKHAAISSIKRGANGIEVKLNDKVKALELMGRHLGMFTDKVEHSGEIQGVSIKIDGEDFD